MEGCDVTAMNELVYGACVVGQLRERWAVHWFGFICERQSVRFG